MQEDGCKQGLVCYGMMQGSDAIKVTLGSTVSHHLQMVTHPCPETDGPAACYMSCNNSLILVAVFEE